VGISAKLYPKTSEIAQPSGSRFQADVDSAPTIGVIPGSNKLWMKPLNYSTPK
jgi:hypothetical protein